MGTMGIGLDELLALYPDAFREERYRYEHLSIAHDSRPLKEIVDLAVFFQKYVRSLPKVRFAID